MGCLGVGLAAALALAVPLSIARTSLVGAYVMIVVLTVLAMAVVQYSRRARTAVDVGAAATRSTAFLRIAGLAVAYAITCTVVHAA